MENNKSQPQMIKAFSLIELMVVIAIVAVLVSVAVPSYRSYKRSAQISASVPFLGKVINDSSIYFETYGVFPNIVDLGYPLYNNNPTAAASSDPNLIYISTEIQGTPSCNSKIMNVVMIYNATNLGITDTSYLNVYHVLVAQADGSPRVELCVEDSDFDLDTSKNCRQQGTCYTSNCTGTWDELTALHQAAGC